MSEELTQAAVEAFRALRSDEEVQRLPAGSQLRKRRIRVIIEPIAQEYGVGIEDVAMKLARMMTP